MACNTDDYGILSSEEEIQTNNWKYEANAVIKDIEKHCLHIEINSLKKDEVFLAIVTLENDPFLIKMNTEGFKVISSSEKETGDEIIYETSKSLLEN